MIENKRHTETGMVYGWSFFVEMRQTVVLNQSLRIFYRSWCSQCCSPFRTCSKKNAFCFGDNKNQDQTALHPELLKRVAKNFETKFKIFGCFEAITVEKLQLWSGLNLNNIFGDNNKFKKKVTKIFCCWCELHFLPFEILAQTRTPKNSASNLREKCFSLPKIWKNTTHFADATQKTIAGAV